MERNKPANHDYGLPQAPPSKTTSPRTSTNIHPHDPGQDSMFLKYASSIIQIVSQDKLEKSNQFNTSNDHSNALIEVSEVNNYEEQSRLKINEHSQFSKGSNIVEPFIKKRKQAKIFAYNFTNFSTFITSINKIITNHSKQAFRVFISNTPKGYPQQPWIPSHKKIRSSVQSKSTSYSIIQELRKCNKVESQKRVFSSELMKEGANAIKGWIQFKILLLQNTVFRCILEYVDKQEEQQHCNELSPIPASKKSSNQKFCLTDYQPESSLNIDANLHHFEQSLAYTIDNNFQLNSKEYTMTTPQKLSQDERIYNKSKYLQVGNPSQAKESIVSPYQAYLKASKASKKSVYYEEKTINPAERISLQLAQKRRYLAIRTNLFELANISELDLRHNGTSSSACAPLINDQASRSEPEICDNVEHLLKNFEPLFETLNSQSNKNISSEQSRQSNNSKEYFANIRQKYSRVATESNRDYQHGTRTCKLKPKNSVKNIIEPQTPAILSHNRHAPHKVENYYFPGKELRSTHKKNYLQVDELATTRLDDVKQVDSILSTVRKEPIRHNPKHIIQESVVNNYQIAEESKMRHMIRSADGFAAQTERINRPQSKQAQQQYRPFQQRRSPQPSLLNDSNRPGTKINIALSSHRSESPNLSNMLPLGSVHKKQEPLTSSRNNKYQNSYGSPSHNPSRPLPQMNNIKPSPNHYQLSKPMQTEMNSMNKIEMRPTSRQPQLQGGNNIYQINQNNHFQQRTNTANFHNFQHAQTMRFTSKIVGPQEPVKDYENYGGAFAKSQQQSIPRPNSRMLSPQNCMPQGPIYATSNSRQNSTRKNMYFSPQVNKETYGLQPPSIKFQHERPQHFTSSGQTVQEYFKTETNQPRNSDRNNFNNKYYCTGPAGRQPHLINEQHRQSPQPLDATRKIRPHGLPLARPHSSSRQSQQRINVFSTISPSDSQLQPHKRSFHHLSSNISKIRPHSMNDKIQLTLRHR